MVDNILGINNLTNITQKKSMIFIKIHYNLLFLFHEIGNFCN